MSRSGIEPGPPVWEARTLDKSHLAGYSEPLLELRWRSARGLYMACVGMDLTGCSRIAPLHIAMPASALSVYQGPRVSNHVGVNTYRGP